MRKKHGRETIIDDNGRCRREDQYCRECNILENNIAYTRINIRQYLFGQATLLPKVLKIQKDETHAR